MICPLQKQFASSAIKFLNAFAVSVLALYGECKTVDCSAIDKFLRYRQNIRPDENNEEFVYALTMSVPCVVIVSCAARSESLQCDFSAFEKCTYIDEMINSGNLDVCATRKLFKERIDDKVNDYRFSRKVLLHRMPGLIPTSAALPMLRLGLVKLYNDNAWIEDRYIPDKTVIGINKADSFFLRIRPESASKDSAVMDVNPVANGFVRQAPSINKDCDPGLHIIDPKDYKIIATSADGSLDAAVSQCFDGTYHVEFRIGCRLFADLPDRCDAYFFSSASGFVKIVLMKQNLNCGTKAMARDNESR